MLTRFLRVLYGEGVLEPFKDDFDPSDRFDMREEDETEKCEGLGDGGNSDARLRLGEGVLLLSDAV